MTGAVDFIIENGLVFDGLGGPPRSCHVGIEGGAVAALSETPLPRTPATQVIDASGHWVMPGFIDFHTHYDAEVELAPSLSESVRHGVTTVVLGSCSLSLALGTPEDLADMFCRVEAIPYGTVRSLLEERKQWNTLGEYLEHLGSLPLGPHVASFLGHSALRAHVMGLHRSLERGVRPSAEELSRMEALVREGLDLGYLGLSIQTLQWDKMGGSRDLRSRPLPSTFARWSEYRRLTRLLRERGRIFQGVPNVSTKVNVLLFLLESMGVFRKPLKTTIISMMDPRANRGIHRLIGVLSRTFNRLLGADFRWQALPEVFDLWADGIDLVVFEEFGAGAAALHLQDAASRSTLLKDPAYRARFRQQWTSRWLPKAFHRDFNQSEILHCPDTSVVGKSFAQVAKEQGRHVVDVFLDLVATHGDALRWFTVMANDRPEELDFICQHPDVLMGFSDAGAHLRNMAHYNFPLRLLRRVREAERGGRPFMSVERAVHRLTGEIGQWMGLDAGVLAQGKRADVVVVNPEGLDEKVDKATEAPMENFGGFVRLVRRNDAAVKAVLISGREAVRDGAVTPSLGQKRGFGQVLRAFTPPSHPF
jgi:N-acyl-D-aspartate/D-glutamate deacylase